MNEITNIHLGRQAFTISVDAYKTLQSYLHDITRQVGAKGKDVVDEVELRMAELLAERGITGDKVVLPDDIAFLKEQLGEPRDFSDDEDDHSNDEPSETSGPRRLYRDTEHATIGGVAAGLGAYLGVDAIIVRLIFIVLGISGPGILIYILLWVLVPEAKSQSDRLQMQGRSVTIDNIKQVIERADVPGAASRVSRTVGYSMRLAVKVLLAATGVAFVLWGVGMIAAALLAGSYAVAYGVRLGDSLLFPVGSKEYLVLACGMAVVAVIAALMILVGRAMIRRKWAMPAWILAMMASVFILASSVGGAVGFEIAPHVDHRYQSAQRSEWRALPQFTTAHLLLGDVAYDFKTDSHYGVEIRSVGNVITSAIVTKVADGKLTVDTSDYAPTTKCGLVCPFGPSNVQIVVHAPSSFSGEAYDGDGTAIDVPPALRPVEPAAPAMPVPGR